MMLPHVVRFNAREGDNPYTELCADAEQLARRIEAMLEAAHLPQRLVDCNVSEDTLPALADEAAEQWTARFNPRNVEAAELLALYRTVYT